MAEGDDVTRLRALLEIMEQGGLTRLVLPDGTILERPPISPIEAAARAATKRGVSSEPPDDDEGDDEEATERDLERRWNEHWTRATRSSGGMIPPYPGSETALRFLGSAPQ